MTVLVVLIKVKQCGQLGLATSCVWQGLFLERLRIKKAKIRNEMNNWWKFDQLVILQNGAQNLQINPIRIWKSKTPRYCTFKLMTQGSTSCNICCSTKCWTMLHKHVERNRAGLYFRSMFNMLNDIFQHSTWHDTLFNIWWTTAATFVDQQMLNHVSPA